MKITDFIIWTCKDVSKVPAELIFICNWQSKLDYMEEQMSLQESLASQTHEIDSFMKELLLKRVWHMEGQMYKSKLLTRHEK